MPVENTCSIPGENIHLRDIEPASYSGQHKRAKLRDVSAGTANVYFSKAESHGEHKIFRHSENTKAFNTVKDFLHNPEHRDLLSSMMASLTGSNGADKDHFNNILARVNHELLNSGTQHPPKPTETIHNNTGIKPETLPDWIIPIHENDIPWDKHENNADTYPPELLQKLGASETRSLSDHFKLTQFGVHIEKLLPTTDDTGTRASFQHYHNDSEEFMYIRKGNGVLETSDGYKMSLKEGMMIGFLAKNSKGATDANTPGHCIVNYSKHEPLEFLVTGTRHGVDAHYTEDDLQWTKQENGNYAATRKDGSAYIPANKLKTTPH